MARTRKMRVASPEDTLQVYSTGLYGRLSVLDNGKAEGDSLESQVALMEQYVAQRPYLSYTKLYLDNGYTGTNFERPAWDALMADIYAGKVNCIVVKDLSRLGRNYIETGEFLEKECPRLGVRFISINDGYDTASLNSAEALTAALKNIINDYYAKDISRKVCSALSIKRKNGEYIGSYAPYGYLKDPEDKNHLVPDPVTAPVVRQIYRWRTAGDSYTAILRRLNSQGVPSPGLYRLQQGITTNNNRKPGAQMWNRHVLRDILANPVYIGHLAQGKCRAGLYCGLPAHTVSAKEWDMAYDTHEAILSRSLFDAAQTVNQKAAEKYHQQFGRHSDLPKVSNPYGKKLICGDCGSPLKLVRSLSKDGKKAYYTYQCPVFMVHREAGCRRKSIRSADLDDVVLSTLRVQIALFLDRRKVLGALIQRKPVSAPTQGRPVNHRVLQAQIDRKGALAAALYTDWKSGILTYEEYTFATRRYTEELAALKRQLAEIDAQRPDTLPLYTHWDGLMEKYQSAHCVTSELVSALIQSITLDRDDQIHIVFAFDGDSAALDGEIRRLKKEAVA